MKKNAYAQVLRLWKAYQSIKICNSDGCKPDLPDGFIISACNPESKVCSAQQNRIKSEKLQRYFASHSLVHQSLLVGDADFDWVEPSFWADINEKQAINLAALYRQNAIYQIQQSELLLVPVLLKGLTTTSLGMLSRFSI
ncbi:DUF3293 domain-containing protein [Planctobacterium marinum]|uniref:DUF3293 domain-containing protein n=1 Tax=Planctobacterium marinum TaxID=1631968 RepID=UPI001E602BC7|nr:DUF3293 domain-containing protein [Planctobacterium marinum]MCC2608046.1 DUF3293 domain-containing protein [Planctobacterium marinum]